VSAPDPLTISVIVPTFNSARYLGETVEAILAQTRPPDEFVLVDDGSTDETVEVAAQYAPAVQVLPGDHAGTAATRHRGYLATSGELVANCDSDDLWLPTKLERQVAALDEQPELHAVGCLVDEFLSPDADASHIPGRGMRFGHASPSASALLIRRSFLDLVGGYDNDQQLGEFVAWYAQALSAGLSVGMVDEVLVRRRLHANNSSRTFASKSDDYLQIMREHIHRQRKP
jgi:glycosyltransferase involved in cell wall biosynthesis